MSYSLSPDIQKLIDDRIRSGHYSSADDVIAAAITNLEQQDRLADLSPDDLELLFPQLRQKLARGLAEARAGKVSDGEAFFDELEREEQRRESERKTA
jgi:antitoxin ParD1/3/4